MRRLLILIVAMFALAGPAFADPHLERVVIVERHGIRPPTQGNDVLAKYAAQPWPEWSAKTGELTPHGGASVFLVGQTVAGVYRRAGLLPAAGCPGAGQVSIWADNADERTRDSGRAFASALAPGCVLDAQWSPATARDPIFSGMTGQASCAVDMAKAHQALEAITDDPLVSVPLDGPLARLQAILAPTACGGGPGTCFAQTASAPGPTSAPVMFPATAALAEDLLLEYADNMPMSDVGWGRASRADIFTVMAIHEHAFALIRDNAYYSHRAGAAMARIVLAALEGKPVGGGPQSGPDTRMLVLAGHDSNLAWMSGVFGVSWAFPDSPDFTAPSTALAFEVWSEGGKDYVRPVVYYLGLDRLRSLSPAEAEVVLPTFKDCASGPMQSCPLDELRQRVEAALPGDCGVL
jgi:4-phytase/acid phosphatase